MELYDYLLNRIDEALSKYRSVYSVLNYAVYTPLEGILSETEKNISCKKGCSACCSRIVAATRLEVLGMIEFIESSGMATDELKKRVGEHSSSIADFINRKSEAAPNDELWFSKKNPCPFLHDGSCSVYEARPLSCRIYHSTDDPLKCIDPIRDVGQIKLLSDAESLFQIMIFKIAKKIEESLAVTGVLSITADSFFASAKKEGLSPLK